MAQHIKTFLSSLIQSKGDWKLDLLNNWKNIVGTMHTKISIEKIYEDVLILTVIDSCWLQELYLLSPMLIKRINENLDQPRIKQLRFKQAGRAMQRNQVAVRKIETQKVVILSQAERLALSKMHDPELRSVLESFLIRCYRERV